MRFEVPEIDVETAGVISTKEIRLSSNAKAFRIIFGQIYPDIIKAIVRELYTNAWDSHKQAGNLDTPVDIHLPSAWEPHFSIRDYGVGMSPEIMDRIYTETFESTKDEDNDLAGMFGMGSKTPLGYTNSYTIMSYINGTYWAYNVYISSNGSPICALVATGETTEPNGVEISLAVKQDDFDKFRAHAEYFVLNAGTPVNINRERFLNRHKTLKEGEGWILLDNQNEIIDSPHIRMGCVLYKIDASFVHGFHTKFGKYAGLPIIVDFDIGDFDVSGSREDIIYTDEAVKKIISKFDSICIGIKATLNEDISNCKNVAEAYKMYKQYMSLGLIRYDDEDIRYKSWRMVGISKFLTKKRLNVNFSFNARNRDHNLRTTFVSTPQISPDTIWNNKGMLYILLDYNNTTYTRLRVQEFFKITQKYPRNILWIQMNDDTNLDRLKVILPDKHVFVNISDLEVPKIARERYQFNKDEAFHLRTTKHNDIGLTGYKTDIDSRVKYYVNIDKRKISEGPGSSDKVENAISILGVDTSDVAGISSKNTHLIQQHKLENLLVAAEKHSKSIRYNQDTVRFHALKDSLNTKEHGPLNNNRIEMLVALAKVIGFEFDNSKIEPNFVSEVNDVVKTDYEDQVKAITIALGKLVHRNPLILHIHSYSITYDYKEIFSKLV